MEASPPSPDRNRRTLAIALLASGLGFLCLGFILALVVDRAFFVIAGIGVIDLGLALLYATGRLGSSREYAQPLGDQPHDPELAATEASDDPSYEPYAIEDPNSR